MQARDLDQLWPRHMPGEPSDARTQTPIAAQASDAPTDPTEAIALALVAATEARARCSDRALALETPIERLAGQETIKATAPPDRRHRSRRAFDRRAAAWATVGFLSGILFWHSIGFWHFISGIVWNDRAVEASVLHSKIPTFVMPNLPLTTGSLPDSKDKAQSQSCMALGIDRASGIARSSNCPPPPSRPAPEASAAPAVENTFVTTVSDASAAAASAQPAAGTLTEADINLSFADSH